MRLSRYDCAFSWCGLVVAYRLRNAVAPFRLAKKTFAIAGEFLDIVTLNPMLLECLAKTRGGVRGLLDQWQERYGDETLPNKASLYRWIKNGAMPGNSIKLLRLCALLDVDPFCLLIPAKGISSTQAINRLLQAFNQDSWPSPSLQFLTDFFGRQTMWPPPYWADSTNRFEYHWHTEDFEHDPKLRAGYYALITLVGTERTQAPRPQTFHFAYRQINQFGDRWLQYGFVVRNKSTVALTHINGQTDHCMLSEIKDPTFVETWFGPGPATFRVASLHPFSIEINQPPQSPPPTVRFLG